MKLHGGSFDLFRSVLLLAGTITIFSVIGNGQGGDERQYLNGDDAAKARTFVDTFLHRLEAGRGIGRLPVEWFAPSYKKVLLAGDWKTDVSDPVVPVSEVDRLARSAIIFDFIYLRILYASRGYKVSGDLELEDMFPPGVITIMEKNPRLKPMLDLDADTNQISIVKPRGFYTALGAVNAESRKYLAGHTREWRDKYWLIVNTLKMDDDSKPYQIACKDNECGGLPQGTAVIHAVAFPFDLYITSVKGKLAVTKISFISE